ncbi:hypothetical protein BH20VER3_BH20VER3_00690 [soil metagenome]
MNGMKRIILLFAACVSLLGCEPNRFHVGQTVEAKLDGRRGMVISAGYKYYVVRFRSSSSDTVNFYEFELRHPSLITNENQKGVIENE